ncbi:hypothetical protein SLS58_004914 [Diplodia intermedia]|uniref:Nuclear pore protein n=1 Tax=Diplodia intermedia TaxID=856260 RepID=A0ABR3TSH7_9PEZI
MDDIMRADPAPIYFDPDGDLRILAYQYCPTKEAEFIVSSKALTLACDGWSWASRSPRESDGLMQSSQEVNPDAFAILMAIAHFRFDMVPHRPSLDELYELAVATEKYGATSFVRPWINQWLGPLRETAKESTDMKWIRVAWAFGEEDLFNSLALRIIQETEGEEEWSDVLWFNGDPLDRHSHAPGYFYGLKELGLPIEQEDSPSLPWSINTLAEKVQSMQIFSLREILDAYKSPMDPGCVSHEDCNPLNSVRARVTEILTEIHAPGFVSEEMYMQHGQKIPG